LKKSRRRSGSSPGNAGTVWSWLLIVSLQTVAEGGWRETIH
jgi:hypothetical protein